MNPLARWIIGPVKPNGFKVLRVAVENFRNLYPQFDLLICHNQLNDNEIHFLESLQVPLYQQSYTDQFCEPKGVAWKLYPPRMRAESHEIVMDNDLVLIEKIPQIETFLSETNHVLYYEAARRDYGCFNKFVPTQVVLNSGIYGMPPDFNLHSKIQNLFIQAGIKEWTNSCNQGRYTWDEQGIVAAALSNHKNLIKIDLTQITNCELDLTKGQGYHFVGINRYTKHKPWIEWQDAQAQTLY